MRHASRLLATVTAVAATIGLTPAASANGRFPSSNYFVAGPGPESRVLALRTTFGLATSYDAGRTWGWICEEALNAVGTFDASMSIGFDGTVVVGAPSGITVSRNACSYVSPMGNPMRPIVDIANDATGRFMVTAIGPNGTDDTLLLSNDGGASWVRGVTMPGFFTETVEMAPSNPLRIYVAGFVRGGIPVLYRSDDGGMTVREVARDTAFRGGTSAYISAVDPLNPDVVYVRSGVGLGTMLLRSDDGGSTYRELTRTDDQMVGFALSDDGSTVWVASQNRTEGIRRSVAGGAFTRVRATVTVQCLRQHGGVLYVCADEVVDGYMLGSSVDGGDSFDALMSGRLFAGPSPTCTSATQVGMVCGPLWPMQRTTLTSIDAGTPPMLVPRDVPPIDLGAPRSDAVSDTQADTRTDTTADVATDHGSDAVDDLAADGATDAQPDVTLDGTADATLDATLDATPDGAIDAAADGTVDVARDAVNDAPSDVTMDAPRDGSTDVPAMRDEGAGGGDGCGCRAGAMRNGGSWLGAALAAVFAARTRRRRR